MSGFIGFLVRSDTCNIRKKITRLATFRKRCFNPCGVRTSRRYETEDNKQPPKCLAQPCPRHSPANNSFRTEYFEVRPILPFVKLYSPVNSMRSILAKQLKKEIEQDWIREIEKTDAHFFIFYLSTGSSKKGASSSSFGESPQQRPVALHDAWPFPPVPFSSPFTATWKAFVGTLSSQISRRVHMRLWMNSCVICKYVTLNLLSGEKSHVSHLSLSRS